MKKLSGGHAEDILILRARRTFKIGVKLTFSSLYEKETLPNRTVSLNPLPSHPWRRRS
ncbi:MAG: hypothetical protein Q9N34_09410 [Aquificota bacterium]|nr:hypothetical protein [Aquificota bacterium]